MTSGNLAERRRKEKTLVHIFAFRAAAAYWSNTGYGQANLQPYTCNEHTPKFGWFKHNTFVSLASFFFSLFISRTSPFRNQEKNPRKID